MESLYINEELVVEKYLQLNDLIFLNKLINENKLLVFQEKCIETKNEKFKEFIKKLDVDFIFSDEAENNYFDNTRIDLLIESINEVKINFKKN